jgi:hypothetical protein
MADPHDDPVAAAAEDAYTILEAEKRKLAEMDRIMAEEKTTVHAKDKSLSLTFDGRGELTGMAFRSDKYRSLPPAQLAHLIVQTYQDGRTEAMAKLGAINGPAADLLPGVDFSDLASGRTTASQVFESLISPMLGGLEDGVLGRTARSAGEGGRHD